MAENDMQLDLDALAPRPAEISFEGKTINVTPPTIEQYVQIMDTGQKMDALNQKDPDIVEKTKTLYVQARELTIEIIPELKGKSLNFMQVTALFELLSKLGAPSDDRAIAELKKRGIELKVPEGKTAPKKASTS